MGQQSATRPAVPPLLLSRRDLLRMAAAAGATSALGLAPVTGASAMPPRVPPAHPARQRLDEAFAGLGDRVRAAMDQAHVPGVAVGVLFDGREASAGFGVTNVDSPQPVDADTLFQIGSITKTSTAMALMRLVDQGRLGLDVPVRRFVPDVQLADPEVADRLTLRHLLTHISGLPADDFRGMGGGADALARYAASLAEHPLLLPLGFAPSYSIIGFSLAGRVLEAVADRPYETAMRELVFDPLGMDRSFFFAEEAILYPTSAGHGVVDNAARVQRPWALPRTANLAGGGVLSVRDQLRYARFWLGDGTAPDGSRLLSREALALMQTTQARERLLGLPDDAPAEQPVLALPDAQLAAYAGEYDNPGETRYTLTVRDGGLEMGAQLTDPFFLTVRPALPDPPPVHLAFETPDRVHTVDTPSTRGAFLRNPDGSIAGLFFGARFSRRLA